MKKLVEKIQAEIDAFVVNAGAQVVKGNKAKCPSKRPRSNLLPKERYSRAFPRLYFFVYLQPENSKI